MMSSFSVESNSDLIFSTYPESASVDTGAEADEEKPETPVKTVFVELKSEQWFVLDNIFYFEQCMTGFC